MGKVLEKIFRNKFYFTRGHGGWTGFIIAIMNFVVIMYTMLSIEVPAIKEIFPDIVTFGVVFTIGYFVIANLLGRYDIKSTPWHTEAKIVFSNNPEWVEMRADLKRVRDLLDREDGLCTCHEE